MSVQKAAFIVALIVLLAVAGFETVTLFSGVNPLVIARALVIPGVLFSLAAISRRDRPTTPKA